MSTSDEIISPIEAPTWRSTCQDVVGRMAATSVGQFVIRQIDHVLWTIEKTAAWSVPTSKSTEPLDKSESDKTNVVSKPQAQEKLVRPLPWFLFFSAVILLRLVRIVLCFAAVVMGDEPVTATAVVYYIQTRRRRLRSIKYYGLRTIRIRKAENKGLSKFQILGNAIARMFWSLNAVMFERPYEDTQIKVVVKKSSKDKLNSNDPEDIKPCKRRIHEVDNTLTVEEMLAKFAEEDDDDSDYDHAENTDEGDSEDTTSDPDVNTSVSSKELEKSPKKNKTNGGEAISSPNGKGLKKLSIISRSTVNPQKVSPKIAQNGGVNPPESPKASNSDRNSPDRQEDSQPEVDAEPSVSHASIKLSIPNDNRRKVKSPTKPTDTPVEKMSLPSNGEKKSESSTNGQESTAAVKEGDALEKEEGQVSNETRPKKQRQYNHQPGLTSQLSNANNRSGKRYSSATVESHQYSRPSSTSSGVSSLSTSSLTSIASAPATTPASSSSTESVPTTTTQPQGTFYQRRKDHRGNRKQENRGKGNSQFNAA